MPLYGYKCDDCGHTWDEFRSLGDHAATCPECDGAGRHRFEPTRFKFTGGARATLGRPASDEPDGTISTRTYQPEERIGDPLLDDGFRSEGVGYNDT